MEENTDENNGLSMESIIDMLKNYGIDAERKSIYADFEALRDFGMDIQKRRGKDVRYHLVSRLFQLAELKLLVDSVQSSKFITHKKSNQLIRKLESLLSRYEAGELQRQVYVANRIKAMNESIYYAVDDIHRAISSDRQIAFRYFEWNAKKEKQLRKDGKMYKVSPWALTWTDENYYMIAYDDEAGIIKHYRVDKMLSLAVCGDRRLGAELFKNFDMAVYSKKTFGMYGGKDEQVTLICEDTLAGVIIDRFGQDVIMKDNGSGRFIVSVRVTVSPVFLTWIMNFGGRIKVQAPQSVIKELKELAGKAIEVYEKD